MGSKFNGNALLSKKKNDRKKQESMKWSEFAMDVIVQIEMLSLKNECAANSKKILEDNISVEWKLHRNLVNCGIWLFILTYNNQTAELPIFFFGECFVLLLYCMLFEFHSKWIL